MDVRATPYQARDQWRPWIREEMEGFLEKIKELGARGTNYNLIPRGPIAKQKFWLEKRLEKRIEKRL